MGWKQARARGLVATMVAAGLVLAACGTTLRDGANETVTRRVVSGGTGGAATDGGALSTDGTVAGGGSTGGGSTGGGGTGSGTPSGGAATPGASAGPADTSPITIGFLSTDVGNASAFGLSLGQTFTNADAIRAVVAGINAKGGVAGRKIKAVIAKTDTASVSWEADYAAACASFTQDDHVAAVLGYSFAFFPSFETCLANAGIPHLTNAYNIGDTAAFNQYTSLFSLSSATQDRDYATLLTGAVQYGTVTPASKIGVITSDCATDLRAWTNGGEPTAQRLHLDVSNHERLSCPSGSADVSSAVTQLQSAALRFRTRGVDTIMVEGPALLIFSGTAESQGWHPKYLASTLTGGAAIPGNVPETQAVNIHGVGWLPAADVAASKHPPKNAATQRCIDLLRTQGLAPSGFGDFTNAYWTCDAVFLFEKALQITRGHSDAASVTAAIEGLGDSYQSASTLEGRTRFARGHHDAPVFARPWAWDAGCKCFAYTSQPGFTMP